MLSKPELMKEIWSACEELTLVRARLADIWTALHDDEPIIPVNSEKDRAGVPPEVAAKRPLSSAATPDAPRPHPFADHPEFMAAQTNRAKAAAPGYEGITADMDEVRAEIDAQLENLPGTEVAKERFAEAMLAGTVKEAAEATSEWLRRKDCPSPWHRGDRRVRFAYPHRCPLCGAHADEPEGEVESLEVRQMMADPDGVARFVKSIFSESVRRAKGDAALVVRYLHELEKLGVRDIPEQMEFEDDFAYANTLLELLEDVRVKRQDPRNQPA